MGWGKVPAFGFAVQCGLPEWTTDGSFTIGDRRVVTVPFMSDREPAHRRFVRLDGADAVELPYQGGRLAMWLIVSTRWTGRGRRIAQLTGLDRTGGHCPTGLCRPHHAQMGTDPAAHRPVRVALPTGVLRRSAL